MSERETNERRRALKWLTGTGLAGLSVASHAGVGALVPGIGWVDASADKSEHDGTPLQFMPKNPPDENPLENELDKYPRCPYCGMSRTKWNHSRHLVHYDDGLVDGTCSIHCLAISLSLNLDRGPKAIYAADYGSDAEIKPLVNVDNAHYLIGSTLKPTMTGSSKMVFSSVEKAEQVMAENGGELADFDAALKASYLSMADDTMVIRKRRAERRRRMKEKMKKG